MRILHKDLSKGEIKVKIETLDDLWHLSQVIEENDKVYSVTYRRQQSKNDMIRSNKTEKVKLFLGISVEKTEFSHYSDVFRITGVIVEGEQSGSHHTLNIEVGSTPKIIKNWKSYQLDRLNEAVKATKEPKILIVVIDEGESDFGIVKQYGIDFVGSINRNIPGKRDSSQRKGEKESFYKEIAEKIANYMSELQIKATVVAGPGFVKEEFNSWVNEKMPDLSSKIHVKSVSVTGKTGIWEVVKRGYIEDIYKESRVANELSLIEDMFLKILDDLAVYGISEVKEAVDSSQAEYLLITDELLRSSEGVQEIVKSAKNYNTKIHIVSIDHEGGERLKSIGGIGAILRFKTSF